MLDYVLAYAVEHLHDTAGDRLEHVYHVLYRPVLCLRCRAVLRTNLIGVVKIAQTLPGSLVKLIRHLDN
jgi:hypothetical protein